MLAQIISLIWYCFWPVMTAVLSLVHSIVSMVVWVQADARTALIIVKSINKKPLKPNSLRGFRIETNKSN